MASEQRGRGRGESRTSIRRLDAAEKQATALELRRQGKKYREIAHELGYQSVASAYDAVNNALQAVQVEGVEQLRALEAERLDTLQDAVWRSAVQGNSGAVLAVLKIMERRAKLMGLDGPLKVAALPGVQPEPMTEEEQAQAICEILQRAYARKLAMEARAREEALDLAEEVALARLPAS